MNIKTEVLVCIAFADSHLGQAMKSENNYGNVLNTDSGHTKSFNTPDDGIRAIATMGLNGKYLKNYTMIGELSQGGRTKLGLPGCMEKGHYCYATSPENWNNNVLNCLSNIYMKKIDETFTFRK